jgi:hypothetical protein
MRTDARSLHAPGVAALRNLVIEIAGATRGAAHCEQHGRSHGAVEERDESAPFRLIIFAAARQSCTGSITTSIPFLKIRDEIWEMQVL